MEVDERVAGRSTLVQYTIQYTTALLSVGYRICRQLMKSFIYIFVYIETFNKHYNKKFFKHYNQIFIKHYNGSRKTSIITVYLKVVRNKTNPLVQLGAQNTVRVFAPT